MILENRRGDLVKRIQARPDVDAMNVDQELRLTLCWDRVSNANDARVFNKEEGERCCIDL